MTDVDEPLAVLVRRWRWQRSWTQAQLADRAGLNVRTVRRIESGASGDRLQIATTNLLADALALDPTERVRFVALARGAAPAGPTVPLQLPAPPPTFTGRETELSLLQSVDDPGAVIVAQIDGMGGIGKTALAVQAAHRLAPRFPGGQIHLDLHGHAGTERPVGPGAALTAVLRALGAPEGRPAGLDELAARYRSRIAGRRVLVVLDDAVDESQVTPLIPGHPGSLVLITGRRRLVGVDLTLSLPLDVLPAPDAVALLLRCAGPDRLRGTPAGQLHTLVELCGRLPLAIRVAAARLHRRPAWTAADLLDRLRDPGDRLRELDAGPGLNVAAVLDASYRQLTDQDRRVYRLLGLHPGPDVDAGMIAVLTGLPVAVAERSAERLLDVHLLQERVDAPGRFRLPALTRRHAAQLTGPIPRRPYRDALASVHG